MEADWAAEIGPRLDRIDADWPGFIDLRRNPAALGAVTEIAEGPALGDALAKLNGPGSPVFTCKCDVWTMSPDEVDPREHDFPADQRCVGLAAYVDVVARNPEVFASFDRHESWARSTAMRLRTLPILGGRADLVIRPALDGDSAGFGITVYVVGCGADSASARSAWETVLHAAVAATMGEATPPRASSSIG